MGGAVREPRIRSKNLIRLVPRYYYFFKYLILIFNININSVIFCEAVAIYGIILSIIFSGKLGEVNGNAFTTQDWFSGYALFHGGLTVGFCNLICG